MYQASYVTAAGFADKPPGELWHGVSGAYSQDEGVCLARLLPLARPSAAERLEITRDAEALIGRVRASHGVGSGLDALLLEYGLDSREGVLLMCLAEALLRIPDPATKDALIKDRLRAGDWKSHLGHTDRLLVNASTRALMLTGTLVDLKAKGAGRVVRIIHGLVNRLSQPVIRQALKQAMNMMGRHFVLGRTMREALCKGEALQDKGYALSFDMLGEAALSREAAGSYYQNYMHAIDALGDALPGGSGLGASVSIKLSALHPRYEAFQHERVMTGLFAAVRSLLQHARNKGVAITVDAEEADRFELSLQLFARLYCDPAIRGWDGFGLVIQAYSRQALPALVWLAAMARDQGTPIPVRLVKGAYWDSEIKLAQQRGQNDYPVFTCKEATDVSYLACARFMLSEPVRGCLYPQFASHNAQTIAAVATMATHGEFEFQRLHGMGEALYHQVRAQYGAKMRVYAPVGSHQDLLPYLVRRLLENGANSSFVHRLADARCPVSKLSIHPVDALAARGARHHGRIVLPADIFGPHQRRNARGLALAMESQRRPLLTAMAPFMAPYQWHGAALVSGHRCDGPIHRVSAPYDRRQIVGTVAWADAAAVEQALACAKAAWPDWAATAVTRRAGFLRALADKLEEPRHLAEFIALCQREAGKTLRDAMDEVREAIDFLRFYAWQAEAHLADEEVFVAYDGQHGAISYQGRGVFVCISPWNFPLAIFIGQLSAALVAGNTVVVKAAEQTSLVAFRATELFLQSGIPAEVLHFLPGDGQSVGARLTGDVRVDGVAFTGSLETARHIRRALANRPGGSAPLIAETGGQNAMLVDSSALPEQVIHDVIRSAFTASGQRCSALRVLYLQEEVAQRIITLLKGAMAELSIGCPEQLLTDIGPVIDRKAREALQHHIDTMKKTAKLVYEVTCGDACRHGDFIAPIAFEIDSINELEQEHFGPILHIIRYRAKELDHVIDQINATGFGLTLGIHSRNETTFRHIEARARVGNCYINRDQIGAVVGVQPFGGQGLSGTGPKAGGPHYLYRFTHGRARNCQQQ